MSFKFQSTQIEDVILITPTVYKDSRGYFLETYKQESFFAGNVKKIFVQDNLSCSKKGVIRGLHYQKSPFAQGKLVKCIKGSILDVAVDLRTNSKTFGKWVGKILTEKCGKMLYIPEGCAHGFSSLEEDSIVYYKCTNYYSKDHEGGIIYNDPKLNIDWLVENKFVLEKDLLYPTLESISINNKCI